MPDTNTTSLSEAVLEVYSKDIQFYAQPILRYAQFATKKTELGTEPGLTVNFTKYNSLNKGGQLDEGNPMTTQGLTANQTQLTVTEYGNAISVSEKLLQSSFDDILSSGARLLGMDYAEVLDEMLRDSIINNQTSVTYAGGKTARENLAEVDVFDSALLKDAVEVLKTKNVRKYNGDAYICFIHPHQERGLKDDSDFKNANDYGGIYAGEFGRIDDVRFITTTQQPTVEVDPDGIANNGDEFTAYQAVIFGDNAYGWAEGLPVEMRDGGVVDFGREHKLAWYSIMGSGLIEEENSLILETR